MRVRNTLLLAAALGGGLALSVAGQTGRIAMASHGGRVGDAVSDNLGLPTREERITDSLVCQNDSLLIIYSRFKHQSYPTNDAAWQKMPWTRKQEYIQYFFGVYQKGDWEEAVESLQQQYPGAKLVGFDKQMKKHTINKPIKRTQTFPRRPFQYSHWRGLATVAALGAVGWLLGRKAKTV